MKFKIVDINEKLIDFIEKRDLYYWSNKYNLLLPVSKYQETQIVRVNDTYYYCKNALPLKEEIAKRYTPCYIYVIEDGQNS